MVYYIESRHIDPYHNLALEQFVFDRLDKNNNYFMLWQNDNSIIIGKHQNTHEEINAAFVKEMDITVARRLSGGGAVYHDLGNLNFTFIISEGKKDKIDFSAFCEPVQKALLSFGVPVEISGRNDMCVDGKKFSGNAQYIKDGRIMHHGTILYDSNLGMLSGALNPGDDKIESKGIKSVKSRVTNIRPYMKADMGINGFWEALKKYFSDAFGMKEFILTPGQNAGIEELKEKRYSQWSWNYGQSPPHTLRKIRRIESCGKIEVFLDIEKEGKIRNIAFYGDFFGNRDPAALADLLNGHNLEHGEINAVLGDTDISQYFHALDRKNFLDLLIN